MKISIKNLSKSFQKTTVLNDITLDIEDKSIHCLLGASGSGKTTLLRIIMGALPSDCGCVYMDDIAIPNKKLLSQIGFMPQQDGLYSQLSIEDNLKFFAGIYGMKKNDFLRQIIRYDYPRYEWEKDNFRIEDRYKKMVEDILKDISKQ